MALIQSPIRYPGSKRDVEAEILRHAPPFTDLREPFLGSGAVALHVAQILPGVRVRGWDLNPEVVNFWRVLQAAPEALVRRVREIHGAGLGHKDLQRELRARRSQPQSRVESAAQFFCANRGSWSGGGLDKGLTLNAHETLFNEASFERLLAAAPVARRIEVAHGDYAAALHEPGENVWIFSDPPYPGAVASNLYGKLHAIFDPERFLREVRGCPHKLLITLDDKPLTRDLFRRSDGWFLKRFQIVYQTKRNIRVNELMIANYPLEGIGDARLSATISG